MSFIIINNKKITTIILDEKGLNEDEKVIEDVKKVVSLVKDGKVNQEVNVKLANKNLNELRVLFNDMLEFLTLPFPTILKI